jgi:hypothetical protein
MEVSIINFYILYMVGCKKNNSNPRSNTKFRQQLAMALVGDFHQGGDASTRWRVVETEWEAQVFIPHPWGKHKDCRVCYKRNMLGGRRESTDTVEMYDCKPEQ